MNPERFGLRGRDYKLSKDAAPVGKIKEISAHLLGIVVTAFSLYVGY